ncbi:MAG: sensor histidine kinase [Candidatus Zixiibacteriota bacterium]
MPDVVCYPNQLNQVFMNILVNGAQAIDGKGNITIRTSRRGEQVVVEFIDSGKGISPEHLHKLFDPGFTTKGVGVGTGLGLSIVHQIVRGHGGELQVESEPGKGATFRIVLPVERQ